MRCARCNAELLDTDTFCPVCGAKQVKEGRCPHCNAMLRPGARFCQSCGKSIKETVFTADQDEEDEEDIEDDTPPIKELETKEIPFEEVEKNIIAETAHSVKSRDRQEHVSATNIFREKDEEAPYHRKRKPEPERRPAEHPRREEVPIREMRERDDYEYEDDEEDETDRGIMIGMILVGAAIVAAILMAVFVKVRDGGGKEKADSEKTATETVEAVVPPAGALPGADSPDMISQSPVLGKVFITSDVRVRSTPTTDEDNILGTVSAGETFEFLGYSENRNWVRIRYSDGEGYVSSSYVQVQETAGE